MKTSRCKRFAIITVVFITLLGGACAGLVNKLSGLNAIRNGLHQRYNDEVAVNLSNSRFLLVQFVNSRLNKLSTRERSDRAQDAARFVARNYQEIKSIKDITIFFVASETNFIFFHKTRIVDIFSFDGSGNPPKLNNGAESKDPLEPVVKFNEQRNETDISLTRIQLNGDTNKGIALVPHFTVSGDARHTTPVAPEFVIFDFASYSDKPLFAKNPQLAIYCDGKLTVKGPVQLLPSGASNSQENIAQFLTARISFKSFQKMAEASEVKIVLGSKPFELAEEDIEALTGMTAQVGSP